MRLVIRVVVVVLLLVAPGFAELVWREYEDPSKTVTMELPSSWRAGKQTASGASRVVGFRLPEAGVELTLAIQPDLRRPNELPASIVKPYFPQGASLGGPRTARGKGWLGLRQEAKTTTGAGERVVVGQFYVFGSTLVAVTLAGDAARVDGLREAFERVVKSVRYREPSIDTASRAVQPGPAGSPGGSGADATQSSSSV